jgi:carboxymethylenebutenolidase
MYAPIASAGTEGGSEIHMYPGTEHGFRNYAMPRCHEPSAELAWERTIAFLQKHLA